MNPIQSIEIIHLATVALLTGLLLLLSYIDVRERRLPNRLVLAVAGIGLVYSATLSFYLSQPSLLKQALLGPLYSGGPALALALGYLLIRGKEGFGMGDLKLLAALGFFFGSHGLWLLPLACVAAALVQIPCLIAAKIPLGNKVVSPAQKFNKARGQSFAFGPYIAFAALLLAILL